MDLVTQDRIAKPAQIRRFRNKKRQTNKHTRTQTIAQGRKEGRKEGRKWSNHVDVTVNKANKVGGLL